MSDRMTTLQTWLDNNNAQIMWSHAIDERQSITVYRVGPALAVVMRYGGNFDGWEIFTSADTVDIIASLKDAEARLNLPRTSRPTPPATPIAIKRGPK